MCFRFLVDAIEGLSSVQISLITHDAGVDFRLHLIEESFGVPVLGK
jgi:hypothetical protein